jgi:2-polyprenyl-6-methoxyphenol hydroxylase-like FAD-dependent oxidoreductase
MESLPRLKSLIGAFKVTGPVKLRPVDLYVTDNAVRPGIVLVGDAYATACPISGTGAVKALNDVERLCNVYVDRWMATPGIDTDKVAQFYADADKLRADANALRASLFARRVALTPGLGWSAFRAVRAAGAFGRGFVTRRRRPVWQVAEPSSELALTRV